MKLNLNVVNVSLENMTWEKLDVVIIIKQKINININVKMSIINNN